MTQGPPEHDPTADAGDGGRSSRPPAAGSTADQDRYAQPGYEDAGWHLDLSDVDWGQNPGPRASAPRFDGQDHGGQAYQDGNAPGQPPVGYDRPAEAPGDWERGSPRRPGRHSRPHPDSPAARQGPTQPGVIPPGAPPRSGLPPPVAGLQRRATGRGRRADGTASYRRQPPEAQPHQQPAGGDSYQRQQPRRGPGYRDSGASDPWNRESGPGEARYRDAGPGDPWHGDSGPREPGPPRRDRRSAPPGYERSGYDEPSYDGGLARPGGPGGYRPPVYEEPGEPGQARPYVPESYQQPGSDSASYPEDTQYTGGTQHLRARQPEEYQQRPDERAPGYQPDGYQARPSGEPDYDYPDEYETGQYDLSAYQPEPYAADYQTDIFELTGYGQAVPGLPPPGLPPPPRARPAGPPPAGLRQSAAGTQTQAPGAAESVSVVRSSGAMAAGTLGSRLTGFLRTLVQNAAITVAGIGFAYNLSNTLPNVVYNLALGGILTSVVVPLIVAAAKRESDRGRGYDQRMFTLGTFALLGITVIATAAAVPIVHLYSGSKVTGNVQHLAIIFAFFFIPQIFFYGLSSLIGAILNARGSFAAPMWTPIVNNVVVLAVFGLYIATAGVHKSPSSITGTEVTLLGLGTTLGIVAQTIALVPALRRVGFRWQPRLDFRRSEVTEIGRMGGWMFCYIAATQVAYLITTKVAGDTGTGVSDYSYAWLLFQLPYAVVGISVITALLPRMSAHAHDRRLGLVRADFSTGVRLAATIVVPCSLILAVLGPSLGQVFFAHGGTSPTEARYVGVVFAVFCLGLLPYMIFQLQLRVFYSMHDSKTPAMIGLVTMTVNIAANLLALDVLGKGDLVAGLGVGFGAANLVGMMLAWRILRIRLRGLDGYRIGRSLVRMHAATLPAALLALLVAVVSANAYVVVIIGGGLAMGVYLLFGRALRIEELTGLTRSLRARLGR